MQAVETEPNSPNFSANYDGERNLYETAGSANQTEPKQQTLRIAWHHFYFYYPLPFFFVCVWIKNRMQTINKKKQKK